MMSCSVCMNDCDSKCHVQCRAGGAGGDLASCLKFIIGIQFLCMAENLCNKFTMETADIGVRTRPTSDILVLVWCSIRCAVKITF